MKNREIEILKDAVETDFLPFVRRPSRYIGGEVNQIKKDLNNRDLTFALCFPDIYEIGMSHTGLAIIYDVINSLEWASAERVFSLWPDAEEVLREKGISLFTLESKAAVCDFDVLAFSITNELCYTNILKILDLAGIALRAKDRTKNEPLIIGGAGMSNCCEPIAEFFDIFILGQGEETVVKVAEHLRDSKIRGLSKQQVLIDAAKKFDFVYVPSLYKFQYDGSKIKSFRPGNDSLPVRFENAFVEDLDSSPVPLAPIVPFAEAVHERISIEVMRGCPGRCRFCQASYCRRPVRFKTPDRVFEIAKAVYHSTGFDTISLLSLSTADYPYLEETLEKLGKYFESLRVGISLPSLRVDAQLRLLPKLTSNVRKGGLTIAVEAASEKLRKIINKPITNENLFAAVEAAYKEGFGKVKLYFMVGFPSETEEDIEAIADLCFDLAKLRKRLGQGPAQINAAVSWLVPKPHTPFAWLGQKSVEYFENAKKIILSRKKQIRANAVQFKFHDIGQSVMESAIGRGDRRLADVIEYAYRSGAKFDLWSEHFDFELWENAFHNFGLDINTLAQRSFDADEILPWQHLGGPKKDYLLSHYNDAMKL
ncbi:MAG: TIGR03960 family B12-binding radical SAM protein [Anaerohalosphaeraceae bacterium]|nr:TIGR03960 family B12-binding radical SAM protein [Anaerohalosphaeraceae bacterium]